jgi:hypothetical protein
MRGALMYLPLPAERQETVARREFGEWIIENVDACFKIAVDLGYEVDRMEDIVLVTGCHLARSWVNIAFSESRGGAEVSFSVQVSGNSSVHFDEQHVRGRGLKLGPSGKVGFLTRFYLQLVQKILYLTPRIPEPTTKPMHPCSRFSCRPLPEHLAKAAHRGYRFRYGPTCT